MSYEKHEWVNNEVITAEKLNNLEDGVSSSAVMDIIFQGEDDTASCNVTYEEMKAAYDAGIPFRVWYQESSSLGPSSFRTTKTLLNHAIQQIVQAPDEPVVALRASLIQYQGLTVEGRIDILFDETELIIGTTR